VVFHCTLIFHAINNNKKMAILKKVSDWRHFLVQNMQALHL